MLEKIYDDTAEIVAEEESVEEWDVEEFLKAAEARKLTELVRAGTSVEANEGMGIENVTGFTVPQAARLTEFGFSKNAAKILDMGYTDGDGRSLEMPVVTKRLDKAALEKELRAYDRIAVVGKFLPHFQLPVRIRDEDGGYLVTRAEAGLVPISNLIQTAFREVNDSEVLLSRYKHYVCSAVLSSIRIHRCGILHEDMQAKNCGIDIQTGETYAYDFERSSVTDNPQQAVDIDSSLDELEELLKNLRFIAVQGYSPDDPSVSGGNPYKYKTLRRAKLSELGIEVKDFEQIEVEVLSIVRDIYTDVLASDTPYTEELDEEVYKRIMGNKVVDDEMSFSD